MKRLTMLLLYPLISCSVTDLPDDVDRKPVRPPSSTERALSKASGSFGLKLFRQVSADEAGKNTFISPVSVALALGMTLNGASGATYDSMKAALELNGLSQEEINSSYQSLMQLLFTTDPKVTMEIANSVWYRSSFEVEQSFFDALTDWYGATVQGLDFSSPAAASVINDWVKESTHGKIPDIVQPPISDETIMFLINALYFKGIWTTQFDPAKTREMDFHLADQSIKTTPFMTLEDTLLAGSLNGTNILELKYGDGYYRMVFLLPGPGESVETLVQGLNEATWDAYLKALERTNISIFVPKFRLKYERTLNRDLRVLGMGIAFSDWADFSRIHPTIPLAISEVKHKTFVQVDEEGTEAAAVTSVEIRVTSAPSFIMLNRPFVFAIRDAHSGTIVFIGKIAEPKWED